MFERVLNTPLNMACGSKKKNNLRLTSGKVLKILFKKIQNKLSSVVEIQAQVCQG